MDDAGTGPSGRARAANCTTSPSSICAVVGLSARKPCCAGVIRRGLLPPGQFLPVVESSGLMPEIGAWVLGEACRQMRDWRMLAWRPFRLAVNVSASQVGPDFDGWVKGVLADAELPAEYLEIELTESVAFGDPAIFPPGRLAADRCALRRR